MRIIWIPVGYSDYEETAIAGYHRDRPWRQVKELVNFWVGFAKHMDLAAVFSRFLSQFAPRYRFIR